MSVMRWLRGWLPGSRSPRRRVRVPVVVDLGDGASVWTLEVRGSSDGPGGPLPDPRMAVTPDRAFTDALANAYEWAYARKSFPRRANPAWTVVWCLLDEDGNPSSGPVSGGSLGAAFGIGMTYLFGLGVSARRRLDPLALVSAGLSTDGALTTVHGLETKVRALGERRARLLVARDDEVKARDIRTGDHPAVYSGTKAADALRFARAPRYKSVPLVLAAVLVAGAVFTWAAVQNAAAAEAEELRLAQQLAGTARQHLAGDPAGAALAAVAAVSLRPDEPTAQASLLNAAVVDTRFDGVVVPRSTTMGMSPDGIAVASGGDDHSVTLTSTGHDRRSRTARAGGGRVVAMAFSRDSRVLVTGDELGSVVRWDLATLTPTSVFRPDSFSPGPVRAVAVTADGAAVAFADRHNAVFLYSRGGTHETGGGGTVTSLAFTSPDTLVIGAMGRKDIRPLRVVTATASGLDIRDLLPKKTRPFAFGVTAVAVTGDGHTLLTGESEGSVTSWDTATMTKRKSLDAGSGVVGISPDEAADTALITTTSLNLATSVDLEVGKATTQLWDLRDDQPRSAPLGGDFRTAMVSADRWLRSAAVRATSGAVTRWTDLDAERMRQDGIVTDIVPDPLHPSGFVTAGMGGRIDFVDATNGRVNHSLAAAGPEQLRGLAVDRTGNTVATAHSEGTVLLRDRASGAVRGKPLKAGEDMVYRIAFSPTADLLATGSGDGVVRLWDTTTGALVREWTTGANVVHQVMFDATGHRVYVADSRVTDLAVEGGLWWAATDSNEVHDRQTVPYSARGMALMPDGQVLVGFGDGTLAATDDRLRPIPVSVPVRHRLNILALAYSSKAGRVVSAGGDNTFTVLRADDLSQLVELSSSDADLTGDDVNVNGLYSAAITLDGRFAVVGGHGGRVQVVPLDRDLLVDRACHLAGRPATSTDLRVTEAEFADLEVPC